MLHAMLPRQMFFTFHLLMAVFLGRSVDAARAEDFYGIIDPILISVNGDSYYGPRACERPLRELYLAMHDYSDYAAQSAEKRAREVFTRRILPLISIPRTDPCGPWIHGSYVLQSLDLYNRHYNDRAAGLLNFATPLYYAHRFRPLTPALRNEWGGFWTRRESSMGTYVCTETLIYFDPTISPYDVGAVIAHELEHFVRDKYSFWDRPEFLSDVTSALILDETLATLHAGYLQFGFRRDEIRKDPSARNRSPLDWANGGVVSAGNRYKLSSDLRLFKPRGHLFHLWSDQVKKRGWELGVAFSDFFIEVLYPASQEPRENFRRRHWDGILTAVSHAYFDGQQQRLESVSSLLERWATLDEKLISPLGTIQDKLLREMEWGVPGAQKKFEAKLNRRIRAVSPGCARIQEAIRKGEVRDYLGAKLAIPRSEFEGSNPGPKTPVAPSEGGQGTRPALPVTPCLYPPEGI